MWGVVGLKRIILLVLVFLLVALSTGIVVHQTRTARTNLNKAAGEYSGFLICRSCAESKNGLAMDGVNVLTNPERHTTACLKMQSCVLSGYGIMVKSGNRYDFYPFDKKGSDLAYQQIVCRTAKADHLLVAVNGTIQNGVLTVNTIVAK